jgi:hypothetical protein
MKTERERKKGNLRYLEGRKKKKAGSFDVCEAGGLLLCGACAVCTITCKKTDKRSGWGWRC